MRSPAPLSRSDSTGRLLKAEQSRSPSEGSASHSRARSYWEPKPDHRYCGRRLTGKRAVDRIIAVALLVAVSPVMAILAVAIRLTSNGPAIYRQRRVGRNGRVFTLFKFRTMHTDAEARLDRDPDLHAKYLEGGFKLSLQDDPRVTRFGKLLRRTSLDELPQLLNIVRGDMSLVGPRPIVPEQVHQYGYYVEAYLMAFPGITGAWQVSARDAVKFPGRARFDAEYIDNWSLTSDAKIILRTLPAALSARGVE